MRLTHSVIKHTGMHTQYLTCNQLSTEKKRLHPFTPHLFKLWLSRLVAAFLFTRAMLRAMSQSVMPNARMVAAPWMASFTLDSTGDLVAAAAEVGSRASQRAEACVAATSVRLHMRSIY
jgi:hypothetical protein